MHCEQNQFLQLKGINEISYGGAASLKSLAEILNPCLKI